MPWGREPASRPRQQRRRAVESLRFVFEEPRQPFAVGGVERAQTQVLADALLMLGNRLPVGVSRKVASRIRRVRKTSGSETGTVLSGTNARSGRTVQEHGT